MLVLVLVLVLVLFVVVATAVPVAVTVAVVVIVAVVSHSRPPHPHTGVSFLGVLGTDLAQARRRRPGPLRLHGPPRPGNAHARPGTPELPRSAR